MKTRAIHSMLMLLALVLATSCSEDPTGPDPSGNPPPQEFPNTYPPIPRPTSPDETIPDESEIYVAIAPIAGRKIDFAPYWSEGLFTWNVDIQTQYDKYIGGWDGDAPGDYWNGTAHSSALTFESGVVDLRNPTPIGQSWGDPHPRRVMFFEQGVKLVTPRNPDPRDVFFYFQGGYAERRFPGALFGGYWLLDVAPAFGERERRRAYYVAAMSCGQVEKAPYIKRERFWKRLSLNGGDLKSIRVDPGASFSVTYTRTQGTATQNSYTFTQTLNAEVPIPYIGAKLGGSLSEAFGSQITISEETEVSVTKEMTGMDGKTVIYSVWSSVERYTICHADGQPYTDPNFTFSDPGNALIQGEYEWISSTAFDYE